MKTVSIAIGSLPNPAKTRLALPCRTEPRLTLPYPSHHAIFGFGSDFTGASSIASSRRFSITASLSARTTRA